MKPSDSPKPAALSRRDALKWLAGTAAAGASAPALAAPGETVPTPAALVSRSPIHDPDFAKPVFPWDKQLTEAELKTIGILADIILPKDDNGPAASEVGVPAFINEWCSAPYGDNREDCELVRGGIAWLHTEGFRRQEKGFDELGAAQRIEIVDDICDASTAKPTHAIGAVFFKRFRQLCLGGYYTHSSTWKHLGYVGNVSVGGPYPGVPQAIIEKLGLQDVV